MQIQERHCTLILSTKFEQINSARDNEHKDEAFQALILVGDDYGCDISRPRHSTLTLIKVDHARGLSYDQHPFNKCATAPNNLLPPCRPYHVF